MIVFAGSMVGSIAIIATLINPLHCDFRQYRSLAKFATMGSMSVVVDGSWIKSRLTGARGEKAAVAKAMGISPQKLTHTLSGARNVQPAELPGLLRYFGETIGAEDRAPLISVVEEYLPHLSPEQELAVETLIRTFAAQNRGAR